MLLEAATGSRPVLYGQVGQSQVAPVTKVELKREGAQSEQGTGPRHGNLPDDPSIYRQIYPLSITGKLIKRKNSAKRDDRINDNSLNTSSLVSGRVVDRPQR